jgi:cobaltochelatase CobN
MGMESYFRDKNPFALQEMTAVMLETARKGMWDASPERLSELASLHVALIRDHKPGCSGFVCDNAKLQEFVGQRLPDSERSAYTNAIESVRRSNSETGDSVKGLALEKQSAGKSRQQEKTFSPSNSSSKKEDLPRQDTNRDEIPVVWLAAGFLALATTTALLIIRSRHA